MRDSIRHNWPNLCIQRRPSPFADDAIDHQILRHLERPGCRVCLFAEDTVNLACAKAMSRAVDVMIQANIGERTFYDWKREVVQSVVYGAIQAGTLKAY